MARVFYVCSYGGCGSKMLCKYLNRFGEHKLIHSAEPPLKLTYPTKPAFLDRDDLRKKILKSKHQFFGASRIIYPENQSYLTFRFHVSHRAIAHSYFGSDIIPDNEVENITVIYMYRNPTNAFYSILGKDPSLKTLNPAEKRLFTRKPIKDTIEKANLRNKVGERFFKNYTTKNPDRNYKIYCVKYDDFFNNISEFNQTLNIPDIKSTYPIKKEFKYHMYNGVADIFSNLLAKMDNMPFIKII